jgi:signal transduction histidine kinase
LEALLRTSAKERVERAVSHLNEVDKRLQAARGHLRKHYSTPLRDSVERAVARRRHELEGIGATVAVSGLDEERPSVFCSGVALEKILDGLVDNAIHAMASSTRRVLAIDVRSEGDHYIVDVRDTGRGIAQGDWERIFDRQYTTKFTGGFGLYYARKELARFNGRIFVAESAVGEGTTIRFVMRSA